MFGTFILSRLRNTPDIGHIDFIATNFHVGMLCTMPLRFLPLVTGLLPIVAIHASLVLAIDAGAIPACVPYFDGCASISATGRYEPAVFLFKPAMTAEAILMVFYWLLNVAWLKELSRCAGNRMGMLAPVISVLGVTSAIALLLYVTFLGTQAPFYEFMRRFGIYAYFLFSVIAQLMLARQSLQLSKQLNLSTVMRISRAQLWLAVTPFLLGVLNLGLKSTLDDADPAENVIEWISALMMQIYLVLTYFAWANTRFRGDLRIELPAKD
jgi:hypothetical protein